VERGAVLQGSGSWNDYSTRLQVGALAGGEASAATPPSSMLLYARDVENIAITGSGVIDGNGRAFVIERGQYIYKMPQERPFTFFLIGCRGLTLRDIIIRDGALWTVRLSGCEDVAIHSIHIQNDLKLPNNDGIDLDRCRNVRISDCHIVCGDDCICLKTCLETEGYGNCENITVTGCTLVSTSSALILGAEVRAPIRNVIFDSCVIQSSHRGLAIHLSEGNDIENVLFSNMVVETRIFHDRWWGRGEPIYITAIPWDEQRAIGHVRHIRFTNILCRSENGALIQGWEPGLIDDVLLENVRIELSRWSSWPGGQHDLRPSPREGLIEHPTAAFFIKNASNVTLRNCQANWGPNPPENFRYALEVEGSPHLVAENFRGDSAHPDRYLAIWQPG